MKLFRLLIGLFLCGCSFNSQTNDKTVLDDFVLTSKVHFSISESDLAEESLYIASLGAGGFDKKEFYDVFGLNVSSFIFISDKDFLVENGLISGEKTSDLFTIMFNSMSVGIQPIQKIEMIRQDENLIFFRAEINPEIFVHFAYEISSKNILFILPSLEIIRLQ